MIIGIHISDQVGARRSLSPNLFCLPCHLDYFRADSIHFQEIRSHAFQHDLAVDVDHMGMTNFAPIYYGGHLHSRSQFVALRLNRKDTYLAGFQIFENFSRQIYKRARGEVF